MSDTLPPSPKQTEVAVLESEAERWKNLYRRNLFFCLETIPDDETLEEVVNRLVYRLAKISPDRADECISRLMKRAGRA